MSVQEKLVTPVTAYNRIGYPISAFRPC